MNQPYNARMTSRAVQFGAVYVIAGVIISIAVAWGCALWEKGPPEWEKTLHSVNERSGGFIRTARGTSVVEVVSPEHLQANIDHPSVTVRRGPQSWSIAQAVGYVERATPQGASRGCVFAYGWPFRCVWARFTRDQFRDYVLADGDWAIVVGERNYWPPKVQKVLAVRPLWLGLAVNALLYGTLIALLSGTFVFLRRRRRSRSGLCATCGYDISGATHANCPECGAACNPPSAGNTAAVSRP